MACIFRQNVKFDYLDKSLVRIIRSQAVTLSMVDKQCIIHSSTELNLVDTLLLCIQYLMSSKSHILGNNGKHYQEQTIFYWGK